MVNYFFLTGMMMFLMGMASLITRHKHILAMLMSLEMMALSIMILMSTMMTIKLSSNFPLIMFICMLVCEASLGLSILVFMSRMFGTTLISTTNLFLW